MSYGAPVRWAIQPALTAAPELWRDAIAWPLFWGANTVGLARDAPKTNSLTPILTSRGPALDSNSGSSGIKYSAANLNRSASELTFVAWAIPAQSTSAYSSGAQLFGDTGANSSGIRAFMPVGSNDIRWRLPQAIGNVDISGDIFAAGDLVQYVGRLGSGSQDLDVYNATQGTHYHAAKATNHSISLQDPVYYIGIGASGGPFLGSILYPYLQFHRWTDAQIEQNRRDPFEMFRTAPRVVSLRTYHGLQAASWHVKTQQSRDTAWNILTSSLVSAAWWRIYITNGDSPGNIYGVDELEFRPTPNTTYQPQTGTASASGYRSYPAKYAFDGNNGTAWWSSAMSGSVAWLAYQYSAEITPKQVYIQATGTTPNGIPSRPTAFDVQYSTDGTHWTTLKSFSNVTYTNNVFTGTIQTAPTVGTQASAWRILTSGTQAGAWNLLTRNEQISTWSVINQGIRDLAWRIKTNDFQDSAWSVQTSSNNPTDWQIRNTGSRATAWQIITSGHGQRLISWNILTSLPISTRWHVKTSGQSQSAWRLLNSKSEDTAYSVLTKLSQQIAWTLYAQGRIDTTWKIHALNSASVAMAWRILNETNLDTSWTVGGIWQSVSATATDWTEELDTITNWTQVH